MVKWLLFLLLFLWGLRADLGGFSSGDGGSSANFSLEPPNLQLPKKGPFPQELNSTLGGGSPLEIFHTTGDFPFSFLQSSPQDQRDDEVGGEVTYDSSGWRDSFGDLSSDIFPDTVTPGATVPLNAHTSLCCSSQDEEEDDPKSITPEPSTFFLLGIGLLSLGVFRKRKLLDG